MDSTKASRGEVLIAILNNLLDLTVARDQHWYRIPVRSVEKFLKPRWPPRWLAFYHTKVFGPERYAVNYYARVLRIREVFRWQLFPDEPRDEKAQKRYHQLMLSPLERLPRPILSARWRRIVFIPTTWSKFINAVEINDLYDESPLEDRLWAELKRLEIVAERQFYVPAKDRRYALDFAIFCDQGKLDVETDGDTWHADPARIPLDNQRDNDLTGLGWSILRFNGHQIRETVAEYCVPTVLESINRLGGLTTEGIIPRTFDPDHPEGPRQLALFEAGPEYELD
jgi:very-short-patch-repair endonuclease